MPSHVEGADEAARAYQAIGEDARDMTDANRAIAGAGEQAARARAPAATGALAGSITGAADARSATLAVGVAYWPYQEFGTRYVLAKRYLRAGAEAMTAAADPAYRARMAAIIGRRT